MVVLAEHFEQQTITEDIEKNWANQGEVLRGGISRIYLSLPKLRETMPRNQKTVGHVISEQHWKNTFDFTEIVNNYGLKRETIWLIVRFISHFSLKLYIQFWKYIHSMILGRLGRRYCKKNRVLEFLDKIFG